MKNKSDVCGIHDGYDSTVALLMNGILFDILQEERIVRIKNTGNFPEKSLHEIITQPMKKY
jgi:predicted NodU family carbamoyl transferase